MTFWRQHNVSDFFCCVFGVQFYSLGTFVFTFVSQHTVHLVYGSLRPDVRNLSNFKKISSVALLASAALSLTVGVFVYITFWESTKSDIFQIYPPSWMIDSAKLLLCITMLLTFPLPFFACRELVIVTFLHPFCLVVPPTTVNVDEIERNDLQEPLLLRDSEEHPVATTEQEQDQEDPNARCTSADSMSIRTELSRVVMERVAVRKWLLDHDDRQLVLAGHVAVTGKLWFVTTCLAIAAPNLGDVLDLVGCASGTMIAFIIPALLSLRLEGYSHLALLILLVGGTVGTVGTFCSMKKLFRDVGA
jgi:amino acid permease